MMLTMNILAKGRTTVQMLTVTKFQLYLTGVKPQTFELPMCENFLRNYLDKTSPIKKFSRRKRNDYFDPDVDTTYSYISSDNKGKKKSKPRIKDPIRRMYRKKVNSFIKEGVYIAPHSNTKNIAETVKTQEDIDELTTIYNAVRYGDSKK